MDYTKPSEVIRNMVATGTGKAALGAKDILIRGSLSGALLACATSFAFTGALQTSLPLVGAIIFPVGFVMIILLGLELVTGSFAIVPLGRYRGAADPDGILSHPSRYPTMSLTLRTPMMSLSGILSPKASSISNMSSTAPKESIPRSSARRDSPLMLPGSMPSLFARTSRTLASISRRFTLGQLSLEKMSATLQLPNPNELDITCSSFVRRLSRGT